jgi:hypothetical protein
MEHHPPQEKSADDYQHKANTRKRHKQNIETTHQMFEDAACMNFKRQIP